MKFFNDVYTLRSTLVHDGVGDPQELSRVAADLEGFVADLIEATLNVLHT